MNQRGARPAYFRPSGALFAAAAVIAAAAVVGCGSAKAGAGSAPAASPKVSASAPAPKSDAPLPTCPALWPTASAPGSSAPSGNVGELVPGSPLAAVVCRYAGKDEQKPTGALAGSATVKSGAELTRLQNALNSGEKIPAGTPNGCMQDNGDSVLIFVSYPAGTPERSMYYDFACLGISEGMARFQPGPGVVDLITQLTGQWTHDK